MTPAAEWTTSAFANYLGLAFVPVGVALVGELIMRKRKP